MASQAKLLTVGNAFFAFRIIRNTSVHPGKGIVVMPTEKAYRRLMWIWESMTVFHPPSGTRTERWFLV
jgi:hypothetical protein